MNGRLIVFEGTDGSGKATQAKLLCQELTRRGIPFKKLDFPRYGEESSALVRLYLGGAFGHRPDDVNAYAASTFYAVDRYASYKQDWGSYYEAGGLLIADRYTTSNAVHQASKMQDADRRAFLDWLFDFEYHLLGLPRPDRVIYLDLPTELTEEMMHRRERETGTAADIHEQDECYLRACRENASQVVELCGWERINCADGAHIRSMDSIHREVLQHVEDLLVP
jgi:dTMP kinase